MGYRPNLLARGLSKGKTHTIGFLLSSPFMDVTAAQMRLLDQFVNESGYRLYICHTSRDLDQMVERANELISRGVDGLIMRGGFSAGDGVKLNLSVPTVFLEGKVPFPCKRVFKDGSVGVKQAMDYLYALGHRGIYMFQPEWDNWRADLRFKGFCQSIEDHGLGDPEEKLLVLTGLDTTDEDGHHFYNTDRACSYMEEFLKDHPDCTAIFCSNDKLAIAILSVLNGMGIKVPHDISVVGFDNIPASRFTQPLLSTVAQPIAKITRTAVDMLMDSIENNNDEPREITVPTEFIPRQSTATAKGVGRRA